MRARVRERASERDQGHSSDHDTVPPCPHLRLTLAQVLSESYVRTGRVWKAADVWCVHVGLEFTVLRGMA